MVIDLKSTRLLWLYRSFIFKNTKFFSKNKELETIVNALNIKNRIKRIEYVYEKAIEYINKYYSEDLCKFENNQCIVQRNLGTGHINGCCRTCSLVTSKGCPSNNLSCKLIYCKSALGNIKLLSVWKIPILRCLSIGQRLILRGDFFNTKEEIIKDLNYGLCYWMLKELWKDIRLNKYKVRN